MREEYDFIGKKQLDENCLYGLQTSRALDNFPVSHRQVNHRLISAMVLVKKAASITYQQLLTENTKKYEAIDKACDLLLTGEYHEFFPTDALQGGAGTSTNMNVNEVIANLALLELGHSCGEYQYVHPLDDVNRGQSTNDVYPTALRIATIQLVRMLSEECAKLQEELQRKENEFSTIRKLGRTELMDAVEVSLGQEFGGFAQAIGRDRWRIYKVEERLRQVNLGGTAIGTGTNADRKYGYLVVEELRKLTGIGLAKAEYPLDLTQNNDVFVEVSGLLKALAVNLMKISNDLRWMNSGPNGGLGEIKLEPLQIGSTIMPGKVNPVIPEMVTQVAIKVMANDTAITMAASNGNFELNAFLPLIADSLLESLELLVDAVKVFRTKCITTIKVNESMCLKHLDESTAFVTKYAKEFGYDKVSELVHTMKDHVTDIKDQLEQLEIEKKQ